MYQDDKTDILEDTFSWVIAPLVFLKLNENFYCLSIERTLDNWFFSYFIFTTPVLITEITPCKYCAISFGLLLFLENTLHVSKYSRLLFLPLFSQFLKELPRKKKKWAAILWQERSQDNLMPSPICIYKYVKDFVEWGVCVSVVLHCSML